MPVSRPPVDVHPTSPADAWSRIQPAPAMLAQGIHLLGSQATGGQILIVAIDATGKLMSMGLIPRLLQEEVWFPGGECVELDDYRPFFQGAVRRSLGIRSLSPGIHHAPWKPRFAVGGHVLLAVNAFGRIAAVVEVPADRAPDDPEILAELETIARESVTANEPPKDL